LYAHVGKIGEKHRQLNFKGLHVTIQTIRTRIIWLEIIESPKSFSPI
jgi:hypothetical protein